MHSEPHKPATSPSAGITEENRRLLAQLHRQASGPFTAGEASKVLSLSIERTRRLLAYWAARGWLARIRQGLYITVPLAARHPTARREDAWILADAVFAPCYIGGWSACEHWGFTEQIFRDVVIFTARRTRDRRPVINDQPFVIKTILEKKLFGTVFVWRRDIKVPVSDPSRTIVDILAYPQIGGGVRLIAEILAEYFSSDHRDDKKIVDYIDRLGNRTVFKRLGYLIEILDIQAQEVLAYCSDGISSGYSKLDPAVTAKGRINRRWNLIVNATVDSNQV